MTSNAKLALILGGVVLVSVIAIAMMKQKTDSSTPSQASTGSSASGFVPATIDPNLPEWAKTTTALINTAGQVGTSALNVKTQYDLQRKGLSGAKPLAGYSYSISA